MTLVAANASTNVTEAANAFLQGSQGLSVTFSGPGSFTLLGSNTLTSSYDDANVTISSTTTVNAYANDVFGSSTVDNYGVLNDFGYDLANFIVNYGVLHILAAADPNAAPALVSSISNYASGDVDIDAGAKVVFTGNVSGGVYLMPGAQATFAGYLDSASFVNGGAGNAMTTLTIGPSIQGYGLSSSYSIGGFGANDEIVLSGVSYTSSEKWVSVSSANGERVFELENGSGSGLAQFTFSTSAQNPDPVLSANDFTLADNGSGSVAITLAHTAATPADTNDFNGDGSSDLLWRNAATGGLYEWDMKGGAISANLSLGALSGWTMLGSGDFNGDGTDDIVWRNDATGNVDIWLMQNGTPGSPSDNIGFGVLSGWTLAGTGDFNGDGVTDMLWSNQQTGQVALWWMADGAIEYNFYLGDFTGKSILATGDFNGDGQSDLLVQDQTSGNVSIYTMTAGSIASQTPSGSLSPTDWKVIGKGDFTSSGLTDILWQNQSTGAVTEWEMANGRHVGDVNLGTVDPATWSVIGVGDYGGTGVSDVLWRNTATGAVYEWIMQGGQHVADVSFGVIPSSQWQPQIPATG